MSSFRPASDQEEKGSDSIGVGELYKSNWILQGAVDWKRTEGGGKLDDGNRILEEAAGGGGRRKKQWEQMMMMIMMIMTMKMPTTTPTMPTTTTTMTMTTVMVAVSISLSVVLSVYLSVCLYVCPGHAPGGMFDGPGKNKPLCHVFRLSACSSAVPSPSAWASESNASVVSFVNIIGMQPGPHKGKTIFTFF